MTKARESLTPEQVDLLFSGGGAFTTADAIAPKPSKARELRYGKCAWCRVTQPCLYGFLRDDDWSPTVPLNCRLRDVVRELRRATGRRLIDLCDGCVADLSVVEVELTASNEQLSLFGD